METMTIDEDLSMEDEDTEQSSKDEHGYGFKPQKTIIYNKVLPFNSKLKNEIIQQLQDIKENLSKTIILRDIRPSGIHWVQSLTRFIKLYGFCFSKEDHILFVKLAYEVTVIENQEFWITGKFGQLLNLLLKKRELLTPSDVQLPWKPLAKIYIQLFHSSHKNLGMILLPHSAESIFKITIRSCRPYFPIEATDEILKECMPRLCPFDLSMYRTISFLELFLPTMMPPDVSHHGYKLWLDEILNIWVSYHNEPMWGSVLFCLFARLAWQNIGYISWEKHLPHVFTRILWQYHLPVSYKKMSLNGRKCLETWSVAMFIVSNLGGGSKTQEELNHLFKVFETYFHPSNTGHWTRSLNDFLMKLSHYFVQRVHNERHRKKCWFNPIPDDKKLTEDDITAFVKCLQPSINLSVFAKTGSIEAGVVLNRLAQLRPQLVIPPILQQFYSSLSNMTEPHRLLASLQCVVRVGRPLVSGGRLRMNDVPAYPEGPTHVIPLLIESLPGIDPNDIKKCMVTFQFIATMVSLIPMKDCSGAIEELDDLTEHEQQICLQTQEFENLILQFMSRCFSLIENSSLEHIAGADRDRDNDSMNMEENLVELGLSSAFKALLTQADPKLFDLALERLVNFTKGRCMETKVSGRFVATMVRAAIKANSEKTLKALLPPICRLILSLTDYEEIFQDENLDDKILFNMLLLSVLAFAKSKFIIPYVPQICQVLRRTLHLKSRIGYKMASSILKNLLWGLNMTVTLEARSFKQSWDAPWKEFFPIRHWGESGDIDNLQMEWIEPGEEQREATQFVIGEFLIPELQIINRVTSGDASIDRDRFYQSLGITEAILQCGGALPMWDEEPVELVPLSVKRATTDLTLRSNDIEVILDHPDFPSNVRLAIAQTILKVIDALLEKESDDTKAFTKSANILYALCFIHGTRKEEFDARWKSFESVKEALSDIVLRKKQHIRALLLERSLLQYEMRILLSTSFQFTDTHKQMIYRLFNLSTSHYSEVRKKGQVVLGAFFRRHPYSYKLVLPQVISTLKLDPCEHHKQIKGVLYVIYGSKENSLISRRDWRDLSTLCPAILLAKHSEKPSVVKLYESLIQNFCRTFETFSIEMNVPQEAVIAANNLLESSNPSVENAIVDSESVYIANIAERSRLNRAGYISLVQNLVEAFDTGSLHWRRSQICLQMLSVLVRHDEPFPACGVRILLSSCLDDNIVLRKVSLYAIPNILKNQKRTHIKRKINPYTVNGDHPVPAPGALAKPGDYRPDNRWMQYDKKSLEFTEEDWQNRIFIHKSWHGWYSWPKELEVYAPPKDQPPHVRPYEDLGAAEKVFYDFFNDCEKVEKLITFLSLEENKGVDKFERRIFIFFKGIFRNFGDAFLHLLEPHLRRMVADPQESSQRCAAEIIAGMMRGTKHWPFESSQRVLKLTCELFQVVFSKVLVETLGDWGHCLMYMSMDRDPNRMAPLIEMFLDDPVRQEEGSFLASSRLMLTRLFLEQQEWRIAEPYHRLFLAIEPHLANPFKKIRDRIGILLYKIFMREESCHSESSSLVTPTQAEFIDSVLPQLLIVIQECRRGGSTTSDISPPALQTETLPSPPDHPPILASDALAPPPMTVAMQQCLLTQLNTDSSNVECPPEDLNQLTLRDILLNQKDPNAASSVSQRLIIPGNGFQPGDSEERKVALRLMNTICKFLVCQAMNVITALPADIYKFLPHLCQLESIDSDQELRNNCVSSLAFLSKCLIPPKDFIFVLSTIKNICVGGWWRARIAALSFLQVIVFNNIFFVREMENAKNLVREIVTMTLEDSSPEVRQMASQVLSGLFHCNLIVPDQNILDTFTRKLTRIKRKRDRETGRLLPLSTEETIEKHVGALGLKAFISAFPYEISPLMPDVIVTLSEHVNDPQPIANDIKKTMSDFRRTHHDNWQDHKQKFSSDQLAILTDVLVSPSYYA